MAKNYRQFPRRRAPLPFYYSKMETLVQNFDNNALNGWTQQGSGVPATQVKVINGEVEVTSTGVNGDYNWLQAPLSYDLTGSYVFVQLRSAGNQAANFDCLPINLIVDSANDVHWDVNGGTLAAFKKVANTQTLVGSATTYNAAIHKWLRIREAGGSIFWDYSTDGYTWINFTSIANPFSVRALIPLIEAGQFGIASADTMKVDNFNISIPLVSSWRQPVNQPEIFRLVRKRVRQQPPSYKNVPPSRPSAAPYITYWVHQVNQPLNNRKSKRQILLKRQPPPQRTSAAPYVSYWKQPVNQPVRRKPQRQPIYSGQEPFYSIPVIVTIIVSQFIHPVNQFLRSRVPKRQQVNRVLPNPPRVSVAPYVSYWIQPVNEFLKSRVLKRQIPNKYQPPYPAAASQAPYVSYWIHPINQFLKSRIPKRSQPPSVKVTMPPGSYTTPSLAAWIKPVNQFLRGRVLKRQMPKYPATLFYSQEPGLILTDWVHPVNQPLRKRVLRRTQVNKYQPTYPPLGSAAVYLSYWKQPVNQFLRYRTPRRQQPVRKISPNPIPNPLVVPNGWIPKVQQFLRWRTPKRQQPDYMINRGRFDPIPNPPPNFGSFGVVLAGEVDVKSSDAGFVSPTLLTTSTNQSSSAEVNTQQVNAELNSKTLSSEDDRI